jgi:hypothetical protein
LSDRIKSAWKATQGIDPLVRYRCIYRAKVIGQSGDFVSARPFDSSLPDMADIPLRHGIPGLKVDVLPGCTVQIGWDDGRPDRPFAALWSTDASAIRISIPASLLELGGVNLTEAAVLGTSQLEQLVAAFTACAAGLSALGQISQASAITAAAAALPLTLSPGVRIG